jgi:hypothetical protein
MEQKMVYKPSLKSFATSLVYDISPAGSVALVTYFVGNTAGLVFTILSGAMVLFSVVLVLNSVAVHLRKLYVNERGIAVRGMLSETAIPWASINRAVLRERKNAITRTDRLLIIESSYDLLSYVISTLSPDEEEKVLAVVRGKTQVVVYHDPQAI